MAGRKRAAPEDTTTSEKRATRSSKVAKTEGRKTTGRAPKGTARLKGRLFISCVILLPLISTATQTSMAQSTFKSHAVPLHVNITTTGPGPEGQEPVAADPGFLASTTLVPTTFQTGSFGWKGNKRMVVEVPSAEGEEEGEKLHVMLTINATVIGSKDVKVGEEHEGEEHEGETEGAGELAHAEEASPSQSKKGESPVAKEGEENPPPVGEEHAEESTSS